MVSDWHRRHGDFEQGRVGWWPVSTRRVRRNIARSEPASSGSLDTSVQAPRGATESGTSSTITVSPARTLSVTPIQGFGILWSIPRSSAALHSGLYSFAPPALSWRRKQTQPMSYELRDDETVGDGIQRIVCDQIESAIKASRTEQNGKGSPVHETRKHLKKARAALRLVHGEISHDRLETRGQMPAQGRPAHLRSARRRGASPDGAAAARIRAGKKAQLPGNRGTSRLRARQFPGRIFRMAGGSETTTDPNARSRPALAARRICAASRCADAFRKPTSADARP